MVPPGLLVGGAHCAEWACPHAFHCCLPVLKVPSSFHSKPLRHCSHHPANNTGVTINSASGSHFGVHFAVYTLAQATLPSSLKLPLPSQERAVMSELLCLCSLSLSPSLALALSFFFKISSLYITLNIYLQESGIEELSQETTSS